MRHTRRTALAGLGALLLAGCGGSKYAHYKGPQVTEIKVFKTSRQLYLMHGDKILRNYNIGLGPSPAGHKFVSGDGRTPEGRYYIDRRNPESRYHLSLGISYPNTADVARARSLGKSPGGDIFIHGQPNGLLSLIPDWTQGCIAVSNEAIEEMYHMVQLGTPISIYR